MVTMIDIYWTPTMGHAQFKMFYMQQLIYFRTAKWNRNDYCPFFRYGNWGYERLSNCLRSLSYQGVESGCKPESQSPRVWWCRYRCKSKPAWVSRGTVTPQMTGNLVLLQGQSRPTVLPICTPPTDTQSLFSPLLIMWLKLVEPGKWKINHYRCK